MTSGTTFLTDAEATEQWGALLSSVVCPRTDTGVIVYLSGDLGAGKTTLVRGLIRGLGYQGAVKSPTYTLVEPYEEPGRNVYHFDLYRLADPEEVEFLGVADYFSTGLCLIEWPQKGQGFLPPADLQIELRADGEGRQLHWTCSDTVAGRNIGERLIELSAK